MEAVHFDGRIVVVDNADALAKACKELSQHALIGFDTETRPSFKAGVTKIVGNAFMHSAKKIIWQPSFHDHIIRGEKDRLKISEYINTNPLKWELDCFYNDERP